MYYLELAISVIYTVVSVLPVFEERDYFPSSANMHRVQPDYKLFSTTSMVLGIS